MEAWTLADPLWLCLLALLPLLAWLRRRRSTTVLVVPEAQAWKLPGSVPPPPWIALAAYVGLALLIAGMARPQWLEPDADHPRRGYDVIVAIDLSTSMYAEDFQSGGQTVNRLQAIKPIIAAFINERPQDRVGIVTFGGRAYTFAPLTFDHEWLRRQTARLSIGLVEDGTAIGDAIGVAMTRLQQGRKEGENSREGALVVLLTDGASNKGSLDPRQAAELAALDGVEVYTIGAGAEGDIPMPTFDYAGNRTGTETRESEVDTLLLRDIAETTGGAFFRATDEGAVRDAFAQIDRSHPIDFDVAPPLIVHELFGWFVLLGAALFATAIGLAMLRSRQLGGAA